MGYLFTHLFYAGAVATRWHALSVPKGSISGALDESIPTFHGLAWILEREKIGLKIITQVQKLGGKRFGLG